MFAGDIKRDMAAQLRARRMGGSVAAAQEIWRMGATDDWRAALRVRERALPRLMPMADIPL